MDRTLEEMTRKARRWMVGVLAVACLAGCHGSRSVDAEAEEEEEGDPAEVVLGERLFLETRFAQSFAARFGSEVNPSVGADDPVVGATLTTTGTLPGPFAGQSINCRACHLVDEQGGLQGGGVRTYADFARHSPIPARSDGRGVTPRNSPSLVNSALPRGDGFALHFDGEFASTEDLVRGTVTGRNYGWLADESASAVAQVARVIRGDDGQGRLARDFGSLSYRVVLGGADDSIGEDSRIPPRFRIDVDSSTDQQILDAVARLIAAYTESLQFSRDEAGNFNASPYDKFLEKNGLPRSPFAGEPPISYSRRLAAAIDDLDDPQWVIALDGQFDLHDQSFEFGEKELAGLRIFFSEQPSVSRGTGNCVACHAAPNFTDFRFHDTGAAQVDYDRIHGNGAFAQLAIPDLTARNADPQNYLPPSPLYPTAAGRFLDVPSPQRPGHTDLGLWNVFANPAVSAPQARLRAMLCRELAEAPNPCTEEALLGLTVARFKTPGLRSLGQSAPYLHTGQLDSLEDVIAFYRQVSESMRRSELRNGSPELRAMHLSPADEAPLSAFLRALNEDYS